MRIVELDAPAVERHLHELAQLLLDAHAANMALGLAAPLTSEAAADAYRATAARLEAGNRVLFGALEDDVVVGAVHLARAEAGNGRHRAEIQRLVVRADSRGQGIGRALLDAAAAHAQQIGIRLLWLSTHTGTDADRVYERLGWSRAGSIPEYASLPDGSLAENTFHYRLLG